jgi:methyl-accepting chemotaxis protein
MDELASLRQQGVRIIAGIAGLAVAVTVVSSVFAGSGYWPPVMAVALAIFPTVCAMHGSSEPLARIALGATMPLFCAVLVYQWSGAPWMIDLHMTFFAAIAVLAVLADWRPVMAGAAVTAVHHLALNLLSPALVFGGTGDLGRVVLHAVVVVVETGALALVAIRFEALLLARAAAQARAAELERVTKLERDERAAEQALVVGAIAEGLRKLAAGNLQSRISTAFPAAFDSLRVDFNRTLVDLEGMVGLVARASRQIRTGTSEIRTASEDLAHRTEAQASTVAQAMNTITGLVGVARDTLGRAEATNSALVQSAERVRVGHEVVASAITTMEKIQQSSGEIGQIVTLIDGIAFQTNLLALNAGVGFAVVANEVRALAQRSADAARDIKTLITASTTLVGEGVELVGQTGEVLREVVDDVAAFAGTMGEITHAVGDTARNLAQVRETFGALDSTTQRNAAMVEQSHAALRSLSDETAILVDAVRRFSGSDVPKPRLAA